MKLNSKFAQRFFLCVTPLVTGSVFVSLPGFAATIANSGAQVNINNFSHNPESVGAIAESEAYSVLTGISQVTTQAYAEAAFIPGSSPNLTQAQNISLSTVQGEGVNYIGEAQSFAGLIGYNFLVAANETFSFDFSALLGLNQSTDDATETASAAGDITFQLYDNTDSNNWVLLDFFKIAGQVTTEAGGDFLNIDQSANVSYNPQVATLNTGGKEESAVASITGWFSRKFEKFASLVLLEGKTNRASGSSCSL